MLLKRTILCAKALCALWRTIGDLKLDVDGRVWDRTRKVTLQTSMQPKAAVENGQSTISRSIPFADRPTCSIAEACRAIGFGRTKLYELMDEGLVQTVKIGRRRLIRVPSLLNYLSSDR
jgi:excisionase family DNA binding protein